MEKFVHKMQIKLLERYTVGGRVTKFPIERSTRFDDVPGIPSQKFRACLEHMTAFLGGELHNDEAEMRIDEFLRDGEAEIDLRADPGLIERINRTLIERNGSSASFTSESKSGGGRNG